jgi:uncharacterized membrane protein YcaP (DUF421 family)
MSDLLEIFTRAYPIWHVAVRGSAVYWFLLLVFRIVLRRDIGSMEVADLLFVVLVADASSNAMQGEYKSINDDLVLLATLIAWNFSLDQLSYRSKLVAHLVEPSAAVLIRNGRLNMETLRQQMITVEELKVLSSMEC